MYNCIFRQLGVVLDVDIAMISSRTWSFNIHEHSLLNVRANVPPDCIQTVLIELE